MTHTTMTGKDYYNTYGYWTIPSGTGYTGDVKVSGSYVNITGNQYYSGVIVFKLPCSSDRLLHLSIVYDGSNGATDANISLLKSTLTLSGTALTKYRTLNSYSSQACDAGLRRGASSSSQGSSPAQSDVEPLFPTNDCFNGFAVIATGYKVTIKSISFMTI